MVGSAMTRLDGAVAIVTGAAQGIGAAYAKGLAAARKAGVEVLCYGCKLSKSEIRIDSLLPLAF